MPRPSAGALAVPLLFLAALAMGACDEGVPTRPETDATRDTVALVWDEAVLQSIRELKHGPPMNARSLALVHTAMYDAWAAYDDVALGTSLGGTLRRPPPERTAANGAEAVSFAAYRVLLTLFPSRAGAFRDLVSTLGYDPDDATTSPSTPAGVGNLAAAALLEARADDGSNWRNGYADYTGYVPVNGPLDPTEPGVGGLVDPSRWQPLVHDVGGEKVVQTWIIPHWQYVTPFAMVSGDEFLPPPPAEVGSAEFERQVDEIVELQAGLTDEQKVIAEYWADGPSSEFPPGHWHTIAQYVSRRDGHSLEEDVKMFFLVANAVFDAGIAVWTAKVRYDYVRPITAVRYLKAGEEIPGWAGPGMGTRIIAADRWVPYQRADFRTPPFAEYTSGHSGFSMAAATVLRRFTGSDAYGDCASFPAGWTKAEPGLAPASEVTLCWPTFTAAAEEAGMSRLYGGIHFRRGNEASLTMGALIGERVWDVARGYFTGWARPAPSS
ncbi:MAG: vanadium-dependent haloperoxidase [Gemmatimonadota bacterium]|jgi:hypothetical protein